MSIELHELWFMSDNAFSKVQSYFKPKIFQHTVSHILENVRSIVAYLNGSHWQLLLITLKIVNNDFLKLLPHTLPSPM